MRLRERIFRLRPQNLLLPFCYFRWGTFYGGRPRLYPASLATAICREPAGVAAAGSIHPSGGSTNSITAIFNLCERRCGGCRSGSRSSREARGSILSGVEKFKGMVCYLGELEAELQCRASRSLYRPSIKSQKHSCMSGLAIPAGWNSRSGELFPATRLIAHELAHVLFPNGNRFLAEGLAVYLQAAIGGKPEFPNFGRSLHQQTMNYSGK